MKEKVILNNNIDNKPLSGCGAEPCYASQFKKLVAFSLAEVLITMGIIGVVAAITIPSLVSSIKKQQTETKLVKFYSSINQAIKLAEIQYGDKKDWDEPAASYASAKNWVETYLKPYMNIAKIEDAANSCKHAKVTLNDGSIFTLGSTGCSWAFFPQNCGNNCRYGIDIFCFDFTPSYTGENYKYQYDKGVEPYKRTWNGTKEDLLDNSVYGCGKNHAGGANAFCAPLIQMNGWKIPRDYPLKGF